MRKIILSSVVAVMCFGASAQERQHRFEPAYPDVHDPVMAKEDSTYYIFHTGVGLGMMSSADMKIWKQEKSPLDPIPEWPSESVPAYKGHTWAPDIVWANGRWYLYYSCSTFGKNISAIGVASNATLDSKNPEYHWEDLGMVIGSQPGVNDWNAIDPNIAFDADGTPWMTFGSFWDGIQLVRLSGDMHTPEGDPVTIARRSLRTPGPDGRKKANPIEAPFIVSHDGYFYLFVSYDYCCRGLDSDYKVAVGRSRDITGPYADRNGRLMTEGGGEILTEETPQYSGIGHCSVYEIDGKWHFIAHAYDKSRHGASKLFIRPLEWNEGWPVLID